MSDLITEPETFESSRKRTGLLLAFWVFLFAFAVIMVKTESGPNGNRFLVVFGLLAFLLFSSLIVVFLVSLVSGRPKIVVSPVGLKFYETIRTDTWQWWEVGPFVALEDPSVSTSMFYLCAYTQRNYEVLLAAGKNAVPDLASADVRIPVFLLLDGRTLEAANGMANRVHDWRNRYATNRVAEPSPESSEEADKLMMDFQATRRKLNYAKILRFGLIAWIVGLIALKVFW